MEPAYEKLTAAQRDEQTRKVCNQMLDLLRQAERLILYLPPDNQGKVGNEIMQAKLTLLRQIDDLPKP